VVADGWKRQAQLDGTDVTAAVNNGRGYSRSTQLEMAVGFLASRNGGSLPPEYRNWSDDELVAHAMLEKEFNPDMKGD
jgi:hypothetical protein